MVNSEVAELVLVSELTLQLNRLDGVVLLLDSEQLEVGERAPLALNSVDLDTQVGTLVLPVQFTLWMIRKEPGGQLMQPHVKTCIHRLTSLTLNKFFDLRTFLLGIAIKLTLAGWLAASGVQ